MRTRVAVVPFVIGAGAVLLAGCSMGSGPAPTVTRTVTVTATPAPSAEQCELKITKGDDFAGVNEPMFNLEFTNTGSSDCTLDGYPTVTFRNVDGTPSDAGVAKGELGGFPGEVVALKPGGTAYSLIELTVHGSAPGSCDSGNATSMRATVPDAKVTPITIDVGNLYLCKKTGDGFDQHITPYRSTPIQPSDLS